MLLIALLDAIRSKLTGTSAITTAFPGGFYRDVAPEGTDPGANRYLAYTVVSAPQTLKYGGTQHAEVLMQFSAYGNGHDATGTAIKAFTDVFDDLILTLSSGHNINTMRMTEPLPALDPEKDSQGRDVWGWSVSYEFHIA